MESESEESVEGGDESDGEVEHGQKSSAKAVVAASRNGRRASAPAREILAHSGVATPTPERTRRNSRRKTIHGSFDTTSLEGRAKGESRRGKR
ncbi:hypothetical protein AOL_s00006g427 [Orbilia oligospora ATCC 24927]|uniref:Uncharacterized protein n=1 Tax=Arthrobotrys oligospora (strain ATCC 24927 / CBS 115.81 / DSM 1491) TaxID=756982 RepID=G1X0M6_ARTOA|nr:hypothetical protein AOL_s00006g427 [Orbilia oligospora ATCC 24927]EGX53561.1 hypothetical protein AOL_s00006g427 [Orbilia oligospora ATCC 24927]